MKLYLIAGEASGDLHASNLIKAILSKRPETQIRFWGGDHMTAVAGEPVKHIKELAFMGFVEVVANLRTILNNIRYCKQDIQKYKPDALILVDYPGFNMRIAAFAKEHNIPVLYYISPQIWAWKQNRVHKIRRIVSQMYCILPFEQEFYSRFGVEVQFVGNPLIDAIQQFRRNAQSRSEFIASNKLTNTKILALLPGSRKQEIRIKLPVMLEASKAFPDHQILIAGAPNMSEEFYKELAGSQIIHVLKNQTYNLLNQADIAMVTSGTATLETALFKVPEVVCYKGSSLSYAIAKRLVKVKYISLVNLIMDAQVVKELIQSDMTAKNIVTELKSLEDPTSQKRIELLKIYDELEKKLGSGGASERTANLMIEYLEKNVNT